MIFSAFEIFYITVNATSPTVNDNQTITGGCSGTFTCSGYLSVNVGDIILVAVMQNGGSNGTTTVADLDLNNYTQIAPDGTANYPSISCNACFGVGFSGIWLFEANATFSNPTLLITSTVTTTGGTVMKLYDISFAPYNPAIILKSKDTTTTGYLPSSHLSLGTYTTVGNSMSIGFLMAAPQSSYFTDNGYALINGQTYPYAYGNVQISSYSYIASGSTTVSYNGTANLFSWYQGHIGIILDFGSGGGTTTTGGIHATDAFDLRDSAIPIGLIIKSLTDTMHITESTISGINSFISFLTEHFNIHESVSRFLNNFGVLVDAFNFNDATSGFLKIYNIITTTITSIIQVIGTGSCPSGSCFHYSSGSTLDNILTDVVAPMIMIAATIFGFIYMGIKSFSIVVMVATFVILMLAYGNIIPSWFTLLTIIFISAALARLIINMFSGGE